MLEDFFGNILANSKVHGYTAGSLWQYLPMHGHLMTISRAQRVNTFEFESRWFSLGGTHVDASARRFFNSKSLNRTEHGVEVCAFERRGCHLFFCGEFRMAAVRICSFFWVVTLCVVLCPTSLQAG